MDGKPIPKIKKIGELEKLGFPVKSKTRGYVDRTRVAFDAYAFEGEPPKYPTCAGDGGCGARGGYAGKSFIFGFENTDNFVVSKVEGTSF